MTDPTGHERTATPLSQSVELALTNQPDAPNKWGSGRIRPERVVFYYLPDRINAHLWGVWVRDDGEATDAPVDQLYRFDDAWPGWLTELATAHDPRPAVSAGVAPAIDQTALMRAHVALAEQAGRDQAALARVRLLHDNLVASAELTSPDDPITRGAAAERIAAALDGWTAPAAAVLPASVDRADVLRDFLWRLEQSAGDAAAEKFLDDNPELRRMADETRGEAEPWLSDSARIGRALIWSWTDIGKGAFGEGYRAAQAEARALLGGQRGTDATPPAVETPQPDEEA